MFLFKLNTHFFKKYISENLILFINDRKYKVLEDFKKNNKNLINLIEKKIRFFKYIILVLESQLTQFLLYE